MSQRAQPTHRLMSALNGSPQYQESISAGAVSTARNATAFSGGEMIMLQSDVDFYVRAGTAATEVTSANGVKVAADEKFVLILRDGDRDSALKETHLACLSTSGTATIKVFKLV